MSVRGPGGLAYDEQGRLLIDVRGPRFSAAITMTVLAVAVILRLEWLVAAQTAVFAVAAIAGLRWSPYGNLFRLLKRRFDLGPPPRVELEGPPRFAQICGLAVASGALVAFAVGASLVGWVLVGVVLALSSLLALTGLCVGCELYLVAARVRDRLTSHVRTPHGERIDRQQLERLGLPEGDSRFSAILLGSPTCAPCAAVEDVLRSVAAVRGDLRWVRVDAADHLDLARAQHVLRVPTLLVVDADGTVVARSGGVPPARELLEALQGHAEGVPAPLLAS